VRRVEHDARPPWVSAPGLTTARSDTGPVWRPDTLRLGRTEPEPAATPRGPHPPTRPAGWFRAVSRRRHVAPGLRARRTVRAVPRGRLLGTVAVVVTAAGIGGALGVATSGPSPPSGPSVVAQRDPVAGGTTSADRGTDPESGGRADPGGVPTSAPRGPMAPDLAEKAEAESEPRSGTGSAGPDSRPSGTASADRARTSSRPTEAPQSGRDRPLREAVLAVREIDPLGPVVVDADGFTLYRFDGDAAGMSTCVDACASTWPPATVDPTARLAVEGVETTEIGLVRRSDGTVQLTLGGWPVYRFAGDSRPGGNGGHGIGGAWFAVTPIGGKANAP
jgi:predicted lipoprotein with Yx(FWY)xxD motif